MRSAAVQARPPFGPAGDAEPFYNGSQAMIVNDDFSGYATLADAVAGGWRAKDGTTTQDTTTNAGGANLVLVGGGPGGSNALRVVYDGIQNSNDGSNQEIHAWGRQISDTSCALPGKPMYLQWLARWNPGAGFHMDSPLSGAKIIKNKNLELWSDYAGAPGDRAQFSLSYSLGNNNIPVHGSSGRGTMYGFWGRASGVGSGCDPHPMQAGQCRPAAAAGGGPGTDYGGGWPYEGPNVWHRLTYEYVTPSGSGTRDGRARMWYDGDLIVAVGAAYAGVAVPRQVGQDDWRIAPEQWCTTCDLDNMLVNVYVNHFTLASVFTDSLWPFTLDYAGFRIWRAA